MNQRSAYGVRRSALRDLDSIVELEQRCFGATDAFPRRIWRYLLGPAARHGSALTLVAEERRYPDDGAHASNVEHRTLSAIATGLLRRGSRVLRLYSLAVDPAARGQGLGRRLIAALVAAAPRRCRVLSLEVRTGNAPARRLYEDLGLREAGPLPGYYPDGGDGVRYRAAFAELTLTAPRR